LGRACVSLIAKAIKIHIDVPNRGGIKLCVVVVAIVGVIHIERRLDTRSQRVVRITYKVTV